MIDGRETGMVFGSRQFGSKTPKNRPQKFSKKKGTSMKDKGVGTWLLEVENTRFLLESQKKARNKRKSWCPWRRPPLFFFFVRYTGAEERGNEVRQTRTVS